MTVTPPKATDNLDAKDLKARLTENDVLAVYRAIGVIETMPAGTTKAGDAVLKIKGGKNPSRNFVKRTGNWTEHRGGGDHGDIITAVMDARGCDFRDALEFIAGIAGTPAAQPTISNNGNGKRALITDTYVYNDDSSKPHMAVDRDADKQFWQKRPDGRGGWIYGLGKGENRVKPIPYHLDEFPDNARTWLVHCEGEKDADKMREHGHIATTSPGGSNGWKDELKVHYVGLNVAIVPDNDDPGWKYAQVVAQSLQGVANRVRIVELPGLGPRLENGGKDLSDWIAMAGNNVIVFDELLKKTPDWTPPEPEPEPPPRFTLLTPSQLKNQPAPEWMIEGLLIEGTMSSLVGAPGTLKSFLALDWALSIAGGYQWCDRDVLHGPVVYITAEGSSGTPARISAWEQHNRRTASESCYFITDAVQFMEHGDVDELLYSISRLPEVPVFVVIDTLARTMLGGNENDSKDMGIYIAGADAVRRATGAHMLVLHHENRTGDIRGSSALRGALDTEMNAKREDEIVTLTCKKQKDAAEFDKITLVQRVVDLGSGHSSVILEPLEFTSGTMSSIEQKTLDVLIDVFGANGTTTSNWKLACEEQGGIGHTSFFKAKNRLLERGLVTTDDAQKRGAIFMPVITERLRQNELS